jgi:hypothetical protein
VTRDEAAELAKNLLFESGATTGIGSSTEINALVDAANKKVWAQACQTSPSTFEVRSPDLPFVSATGFLSLLDVDGEGVYDVRRVYAKVSSVSDSVDPWLKLERLDGEERHRLGRAYYASPFIPSGYYLEGENLYLAPKVSSNQTLQIVYVPNVSDLSATEEVLGGVSTLKPFHSLVAYEAALNLAVKDEANLSGIKLLRDEMKGEMLRHLSRRRVRNIREVPFA